MNKEELLVKPIGIFRCSRIYPQQAPRQGTEDISRLPGKIELNKGFNFEQALKDLAGFDRIWIIYWFDRNSNWKPVVKTPRDESRHGVFATRAPHRPNPIGISCVKIMSISGLTIEVQDFDLLDGTPVLDIKPYLPYADSFPDSKTGWLDEIVMNQYQITYSENACQRMDWIFVEGGYDLRAFLETQLTENPDSSERKRIRCLDAGSHYFEIAARTWRVNYKIKYEDDSISVLEIKSGYSKDELQEPEDKYNDKQIHRDFIKKFNAL